MIEIGSHEKPKVLIVDDETEVLNSLADLLRKVTPRNRHPETDWGRAQGREVG